MTKSFCLYETLNILYIDFLLDFGEVFPTQREKERERGREGKSILEISCQLFGIAKSLSMINDRLEKHSQHQQHAEPFPISHFPYTISHFQFFSRTHSLCLTRNQNVYFHANAFGLCVCVCVDNVCLIFKVEIIAATHDKCKKANE